jgi:hypothetical protein
VTLIPSNELVAITWINTIPGLTLDSVGTQLPSGEESWATNGAVALKVAGGSPDIYLRVRKPVIQVDCWATVLNSDKLPWGTARRIAEKIRAATFDDANVSRVLSPSANGVDYQNCWVESAYLLTEPRDAYSDAGDYAGSSFDLMLWWTCQQ